MKLDHIMYAVSDLQAGIQHIDELTGVSAAFGGRHDGAGTCNALASFGNDQYLEIIAPDTEQNPAGTMAEELKVLDRPRIRTWAVAVTDFDAVRKAIADAGFGESVIDMSRERPDGVKLAWQILFVTGHSFGLSMPFFINWLDSPHPSEDAPQGMALKSFIVTHPQADQIGDFFLTIDLDIECKQGEAQLRATIESPRGVVTLD